LKQDNILVLDLGSSENTTIARWIRDLGVYSEIHPHDLTAQNIEQLKTVKGIILNGGKNNIIDGEAIDVLDEIYSLDIPVISVNHPSTKALEVLEQWPSE
jgi:GMP synthase (glutamine-hydrolysing)